MIAANSPLRGMTTVAYMTSDLAAAKAWYTEVLGVAPYFDTPAYIEFRIGDYQAEFGIIDAKYVGQLGGEHAGTPTPSGAIVYWHVDDVPATLARLNALGATTHQPPRDFGRGFIGASVIDPFGNILGVMYNPHYLEVLAARAA
jgi:predicted enzyme related to lactoylglutathione lyase